MKDEGSVTFAGDLPASVVQQHMVVSAEQHPSIDVGATFVGNVFIDVMGFGVRGGLVAPRSDATAVACREGESLCGGEEAALAT